MHDQPFYFPLTPDYAVGQAPPIPMEVDQYGNGPLDGQVFQFTSHDQRHLQCKREVVARHADHHVGRSAFHEPTEATIRAWIINRLEQESPQRPGESSLHDASFEDLAMRVPEDLAVTCVGQEQGAASRRDWLAAVHVCMPSGWDPAAMLGRSFAQIHRTVQIDSAEKFLLEDGRVKDYIAMMLGCETPHVRFIWTLQIAEELNRNPQTRRPPQALKVDPKRHASNVFFRVERQTITSFPAIQASLFTIRTYLYPLWQIIEDPARCTLLKQAVLKMPPRVVTYKGWSEALVRYVAET